VAAGLRSLGDSRPMLVPVVQGADGQAGGLGHRADLHGPRLVHGPSLHPDVHVRCKPQFGGGDFGAALSRLPVCAVGDVIGREPELGLVSAFLDRSVEGPPDS
jgi:hypothetical protein